jgi:hypothetical protein
VGSNGFDWFEYDIGNGLKKLRVVLKKTLTSTHYTELIPVWCKFPLRPKEVTILKNILNINNCHIEEIILQHLRNNSATPLK